MNIDAIQSLLPNMNPTDATAPVAAPDAATQSRFAALLQPPQAVVDPVQLVAAQGQLSTITVGTELAAKVAGSLTQTVNKLVNMQ
ncbi:type III secretion system inner rod subunit SctI [Chitinimonas sp. BJB300]|uniref:type III secretion system inner rod subunit SctI n=1 Tax=Chitinimonas sp. BJB300 TaxID=1559339 RepID=UPI000C0FBA53|nr:type III secretion system inner rod subunit SctI [Chitinimonas sp. BJB300]PHV11497.1 EscI/YscI/HrpB family type III secretion system inner rod protein [Chitinimonas sp. BJB300]TSJ88508.1 EscI/YscI/HrpB family type III secretion system inner rod protein [Chitinimonas sp. BJB300]